MIERIVPWAAVGLMAAGLASPALADGKRLAVPMLGAYVQECGSCHVAYAPGLLPAASWQRLLDNLSRHFGSDASLDAAAARPIAAWLQANAGSGRIGRSTPPQDRITRSDWFLREHREIDNATWQRPTVRSAANCSACHPRADIGRFSEHDVRIPRPE